MNGMTALALVYTSFKAEEETFSRETDTQKESEGDNANNVSVRGSRHCVSNVGVILGAHNFFFQSLRMKEKLEMIKKRKRNNKKERTTEKKNLRHNWKPNIEFCLSIEFIDIYIQIIETSVI